MSGILCGLAGSGVAVGGGSPGGGGGGDSETMIVGNTVTEFFSLYGYLQGNFGSLSDGAFAPKGGAQIVNLYWSTGDSLHFTILGTHSNDDWTSLAFNGRTFNRSAATFAQTGAATVWTWSGVGGYPFVSVGASMTVTFT